MIATLSEHLPLLKVLRSKPFTLLWMGQFISILGDNIFTIALAWQVLILTGSAAAMSIVVIAKLIPTVIFLLIGGVTADRIPRRLILLCSDTGRAIVVSLIAILSLSHALQLWHLIALSLFFGTVDSFFSPAYQAIQPQLIDKEMLQSANSLTRFGNLLGGLFGPAIGAICVASSGPASAFALDALSFVISAMCLLAMHIPVTSSKVENASTEHRGIGGVVADVREGLRYVTGSTWLWVTITIAAFANITFFGPIAVALPRLVHDSYHAGAWLLGLITTTEALGAIVATVLLGQIRHIRRRGLFAYLALLPCGLGLAAFGLPLPLHIEPVVASLASAIVGVSIGTFSILWVTILQELVPTDKLGRVSSIDLMGSYVLLPVGLALVGIVTDRIGPSLVFIIGGILTLLMLSIGLCVRDIRQLE